MSLNSQIETTVLKGPLEINSVGYSRYQLELNDSGQPHDVILLEANQAFESLVSLSKEEILGKSKFDLFPGFYGQKRKEWLLRYHQVAYHGAICNEPFSSIACDSSFQMEIFSPKDGEVIVLFKSEASSQGKRKQTRKIGKFEELITTIDGIIWEADPETFAFTYISPKVKEVLGYSAEEWLSSASFWADHIYWEDRDFALNYCKELTHRGESHQFELRFVKKNGQVIWIKEYVTVVTDAEGVPVNLIGLTVDIDEQLKNKDSLEKYRKFFYLAQDHLCMSNAEGKFLEFNGRFMQTLGYSEEELLTKKFLDFVHPDDLPKTLKEMEKLNQGAKTISFQNRYLTKSQEERHFQWNSIPHEGIYYAVARDITSTVLAENKLRESELRYRHLFEAAGDAIYLLNEEGILLDINEASMKMTGYEKPELLGAFVGKLNHRFKTPLDFKAFTQRLNPDKPYMLESEHTARDGQKLPVEISVRVVDDQSKKLYFAVVRDITKRKIEENRFREIIAQSPLGMALVSENDSPYLVNQAFCKMIGYSSSELAKLTFKELTHPDDYPSDLAKYQQLLNNDINEYSLEKRYISKTKEIIPAKLTVCLIDDLYAPNGKRALAIVEDLSEIKKAQEIRMETEERYQNLLDTAPNPIYLSSISGEIIEVNMAAETMLGFSRKELKQKLVSDIDEVFSLSDFTNFTTTLSPTKTSIIKSRHVHKDGSRIPVEVHMKLSQIGREKVVVGIVVDVREQVANEKKLKEQNSLLKAAQKTAKLGHWKFDVQTKRLTGSEELYSILGEDSGMLDSDVEKFLQLVHPDDQEQVKLGVKSCLKYRNPYHAIHRVLTKAGDVRYVDANAEFNFDIGDSLTSVIGTMQDITESYIIQRELKLRDDNLSKFFQNVHMGIAKNTMDGEFVEINPEFARFTGYSIEELNEMSYWDLTPEVYAEEEQKQLHSLNEKGRYGPYNKHYRTKNGVLIPVLLNGVKTIDSNGDEFIWSVVQDMTETEKFTKRLQQDLEKMKLVLETGKLIAFEVDLQSGKISTVRKWEEFNEDSFPMSGIQDFESFLQLIRDDQLAMCKRKLKIMEKGQIDQFRWDFQILASSQKYSWYEGMMSLLERDENGVPLKVFVTLRNIDEEKNNEQRQLISQENERLRISRDIHDSIGQMLVGTRLILKTKSSEILKEELEEFDHMLDLMIKESRLIINNFGISLQENDSLKSTFIKLAERMNKVYAGQIRIDWNGMETIKDLRVATNIFRIYQEALSNGIKYAQSSYIRVNVRNYSYMFLDIIDDGSGFSLKSINPGFGIDNMKDRAHEIGASLKIETELGKGTVVRLRTKD